MRRLRASAITIFCAFVAFGFGYLALLRLPDPLATWDPAVRVHPEVDLTFTIARIAGQVALLAVLLGGAPIIFIALRQALATRQRAVILPFVVAVLVAVLFVADTAITFLVISSRPGSDIRPLRPIDAILSLIWLALFVLGLIAGTWAVSLAIAHSDVSAQLWRFSLIPATVTTLAMAVALLATALVGALIQTEAPQLFESQDVGPLILGFTLCFMAIATLFAVVALVRGFRAQQAAL